MKGARKLLLTGGVAALAAALSVGFLYSQAPDFWEYGKLGVSDGPPQSPVFFVEVRGVGQLPTIAYILRCADPATAPKNMLDVSHSIIPQIENRTRVMDRWRSECLLLVGRRVGETIPIRLDATTAQKWFGRSSAGFGDFTSCQVFWDEFVSARIAEFDRSHHGAGQQ